MQYYSQGKSYSIEIINEDSESPVIRVTNPPDGSIALYAKDFFNLRGNITDRSSIKSINIYINDTPLAIGLLGRDFSQEISGSGLTIGEHSIKIEAVDSSFNKGETTVKLTILAE